MAFIGTILQETIKLKQSLAALNHRESPRRRQERTLVKLVEEALYTEIGKDCGFMDLLRENRPADVFRSSVPIFNYESVFERYWQRILDDRPDVCWPGKTKFFALTSGTSQAASKKIPVTNSMIRAVRRTSIRQITTLSNYKLPADFYVKSVLMLGGSTNLQKTGNHAEGDLSGILASKLPFWFYRFYKPGKQLAMESDWGAKLEKITLQARKWDIGIVAGVPAWVQLLFEKIIAHYKVEHIHDIWPSLRFFVHGGVSFHPYRENFSKLLGRDINYLETYLASEGFLAYQKGQRDHMELVTDNGIFFEFVPFNDANFDGEGNLKPAPETLLMDEVEEGKDYAVLISTCAGAWRYLIGDTIRFVSVKDCEIVITGRTKHFLSLCGEHLSVENMTTAIKQMAQELGTGTQEFTAFGVPHNGLFAHRWYIGTEKDVPVEVVREKLDTMLKALNDDYRVERSAALKDVLVTLLPHDLFYDFLRRMGKEGGQHKFPRVIKGQLLDEWEKYLRERHG